ncbi:DUF6680 family protein [Sphingomonas sp. PAMC 26605]|uniref:DUF6680 family protein n=1 Tax=Sphingomonas sp. PAMC 26605 TaxID=1112214 RepID=UPI00026CDCD0|nr:DUF6680 family protein [Sphingomonas sp. PAMC 26605]
MTWSLDWSATSACLSAIAATAAAIATWRAPISAARIAENLRRQGDTVVERNRFRLTVFAQVMQGRAEIWSEETVRAINSIDVAFNDVPPVREAWAELFQALSSPEIAIHVREERLRKLLKEMSISLGLADTLRLDDFARVYFPTAVQEERQVRDLQRRADLRKLMGDPPAADQKGVASKWPEAPA